MTHYFLSLLAKESLEYWRNWKVWFMLLIIPLIVFPASTVLPVLLSDSGTETDRYELLMEPNAQDPQLIQVLQHSGLFTITTESGVENTTKQTHTLRVSKENNQLRVYFEGDRNRSVQALQAFEKVIAAYSFEHAAKQLQLAGVDPSILTPYPWQAQDISKKPDRPFEETMIFTYSAPGIFSFMVIMGGLIQGSDSIAGEKERGTIETLLLMPIERWKIVFVKFIGVYITNIKVVLITYMGLYISIWWLISYREHLQLWPTLSQALLILIITLFASSFFSACYVLISALSKNLKEAQAYGSVFMFLVMGGVVGVALAVRDLELIEYMIPGLNIFRSVSRIFANELSGIGLVLMALSSLLLTAAVLFLSTQLLKRESIVNK